MRRSVLILGGYGNFGKRIAEGLTASKVSVIIAGRNREKAEALKNELPPGLSQAAYCDISQNLDEQLTELKPLVVINTCGPFQGSDYSVAETCIRHRSNYIDLADGRSFVAGISSLDAHAKHAGTAVVSGASTVPGLSSAVIEHFKGEFSEISHLKYGISPGQQAERGLATTQAVLSYVGKRLKPFPSIKKPVYGWQDIYSQEYPQLGRRWMANCDIPDFDLLPERYRIGTMQFSAGLELSVLHLGLWGLSWLVRAGLPLGLQRFAVPLLGMSNLFNSLGSAEGGMHMIMSGTDHAGNSHTRRWFIVAKNGDGPHIPTIPAIILARQLIRREAAHVGATPCLGMITLSAYLNELAKYNIETITE